MKRSLRTITDSYSLSLFDSQSGYEIRPIHKHETHNLLLNVHYARRIPSISYAFGLFLDGCLRGIVTYGMPPSPSLTKGVAGVEWASSVIELNRLCLTHNEKNEASRLVGQSLKLLPSPKIVVSYSDTAQDHVGVIYQATNFIYTGLTVARTEWAIEGEELLHAKSIANSAADKNMRPIEWLRETYGDRFIYRERSQKHRYVFFVANKSDRKKMLRDLKYPVFPYPKRDDCNFGL